MEVESICCLRPDDKDNNIGVLFILYLLFLIQIVALGQIT